MNIEQLNAILSTVAEDAVQPVTSGAAERINRAAELFREAEDVLTGIAPIVAKAQRLWNRACACLSEEGPTLDGEGRDLNLYLTPERMLLYLRSPHLLASFKIPGFHETLSTERVLDKEEKRLLTPDALTSAAAAYIARELRIKTAGDFRMEHVVARLYMLTQIYRSCQQREAVYVAGSTLSSMLLAISKAHPGEPWTRSASTAIAEWKHAVEELPVPLEVLEKLAALQQEIAA